MLWGMEWLFDTYKMVIEDMQSKYNFEFIMAPLARTPMSKEGVQATKRYSDNVKKVIENLTPWRKSDLRNKFKKKGKRGQVVVMLDAGETADHPLYKDATIVR